MVKITKVPFYKKIIYSLGIKKDPRFDESCIDIYENDEQAVCGSSITKERLDRLDKEIDELLKTEK